MREIIIISGKGGTGKTSLTGAFAHLASNKIICDLDVDAPDLHLLLSPTKEREEDFRSGYEARIDAEKCSRCGLCASMCQFGAIHENEEGFAVDPLRCEGCKVCVAQGHDLEIVNLLHQFRRNTEDAQRDICSGDHKVGNAFLVRVVVTGIVERLRTDDFLRPVLRIIVGFRL